VEPDMTGPAADVGQGMSHVLNADARAWVGVVESSAREGVDISVSSYHWQILIRHLSSSR
jgi:hypothetical protein